jgi:phosphoglycerol geranylgeranyltransferase
MRFKNRSLKTPEAFLSLSRKNFCVLIDPEKFPTEAFLRDCEGCVDFFLVGGSTAGREAFVAGLKKIKKISSLPVFIFPAGAHHIIRGSDGIFFTSLISGRNPDYLIDEQVKSVRTIKRYGISVFPVGYLLVGESKSATARVSKTLPLPYRPEKAIVDTSLAGQFLGMRAIYLEAGSGSHKAVPISLATKVAGALSIPLIVGGGISSPEAVRKYWKKGVQTVVVGNYFEKHHEAIKLFKTLRAG